MSLRFFRWYPIASCLAVSGSAVLAAASFPVFPGEPAQGPAKRLPAALQKSGPRTALAMRAAPGQPSQGETGLDVGPGQKVLIVFVADAQGQDLDGASPKLSLAQPGGAALGPSPLPKLDAASEAQLVAYQNRLKTAVPNGPSLGEKVLFARLNQFTEKNPMAPALRAKLQALSADLSKRANVVLPVRDPVSKALEGLVVLNPKAGRWSIKIEGSHPRGFFVAAAAGESMAALRNDKALWEGALSKLEPPQDELWASLGEVIAAKAMFAEFVNCQFCKTAIKMMVFTIMGMLGAAVAGLMTVLGIGAALAQLIVHLVIWFAGTGLSAKKVAEKVCKAAGFCS